MERMTAAHVFAAAHIVGIGKRSVAHTHVPMLEFG
jgi:hypothetical protein